MVPTQFLNLSLSVDVHNRFSGDFIELLNKLNSIRWNLCGKRKSFSLVPSSLACFMFSIPFLDEYPRPPVAAYFEKQLNRGIPHRPESNPL